MRGRYIDKTFAAVVTIHEASLSQRQALYRRLSPERFHQICSAEGVTESIDEIEVVSIEYDGLNPDRYEGGDYVAIVVRRGKERFKVRFVYENGETEIAWFTRSGLSS